MAARARRLLVLAAVACALLSAIGAQAAHAQAASTCEPYIFIDARGSGQNHKDDPLGAEMESVWSTLNALDVAAGGTLTGRRPLNIAAGYRAVPVIVASDFAGIGAVSVAGGLTGAVSATTIVGVARKKSYDDSVADGERGLKALLTTLARTCPTSKFLLSGYSQGAQVVVDVLAGLAPTLRAKVIGTVVYGDPKFNPADRTLGTFNPARRGLLGQRPVLPAGTPYLSFCAEYDIVCQGLFWLTAVPPTLDGSSFTAHEH